MGEMTYSNKFIEGIRICSACNKSFEVKLFDVGSGFNINFLNCPHCGGRNDIWLLISNKPIIELQNQNQKLKEEVQLCEKLSTDIIVEKMLNESLSEELGRTSEQKETMYLQQISELKELLSQWQTAFHYRGQRLYEQDAQINVLKRQIRDLEGKK